MIVNLNAGSQVHINIILQLSSVPIDICSFEPVIMWQVFLLTL